MYLMNLRMYSEGKKASGECTMEVRVRERRDGDVEGDEKHTVCWEHEKCGVLG